MTSIYYSLAKEFIGSFFEAMLAGIKLLINVKVTLKPSIIKQTFQVNIEILGISK